MTPRELPIYELEQPILRALRETGRLIVQAPTGSGKSTQLPQMMWRHGLLSQGEVVVLQPRRLATRLLAARVAEEMGVRLGAEVGYQIRFDAVVSAATRIRFVTEGILLRRMTADPHLRGVAALVFDEFHERHLYGDIGLARALQIQKEQRPDLKIVVMSATLEAARLREYLAPCEVLESAGRTFPVDVTYLRSSLPDDRDALWEAAADACAELIRESSSGDALVFMPGAYEISRTIQALQMRRDLQDCLVCPLHGELPPAEQDRAVSRHGGRKIIVSTNVAETSLTIEGVTLVVDSGLARIARYDPNRGINTLLIEKISAASADQRAGRAGRTAPGRCLRLWTEREQRQRPLQELPEVKKLDLAEVVLTLKAAGIDDLTAFPWVEAPESRALERATLLLADLGALDARGRITAVGRRMLAFPVHPRYARMLLAAEQAGCVRSVALLAALTQGRNFWLRGVGRDVQARREELFGDESESDFFLLMRAWRYADRVGYAVEPCRRMGIHAQAARQVGPLFEQFLRIAREENLQTDGGSPADRGQALRKCILAGFSDQVAVRLDGGTLRCRMVHQRTGFLSRDSALQRAPLLVAAEVSEIEGRGGEVTVTLGLATAVEEAWLAELFPEDCVETTGVVFDPAARRVIGRRERRFRDLVLETKETAEDPPPGLAAALLAREIESGRCSLKEWDEKTEQWILRVNRLAEWFPEYEVAPIGQEDRRMLLEQICYGALSCREARERPVWPVLKSWLTQEQLAALETTLPERMDMANGRRARIRYAAEGPPVLSARIQELYGVEKGIALGGKVPVKIEVLAPNQRPIQITDDLALFWKEMYPKVKQELQRRYPRHEWR